MRLHLTDSASLPHRAASWLALWLFALGTSVTLVAGWGRSVASDQSTLAVAAEKALASEVASERLGEWLAEGVSAAQGLPSDQAREVIDDLWEQPEVKEATEAAIAEIAAATVADPDEPVDVDLRDELAAAAPAVTSTFERHGLPAIAAEDLVETAAPLLVEQLDAGPVIGTVDASRGLTTLALLFGLGVMIVAAASALNLAEDRVTTVRTLASRVATSAVTFGVMLQLGAWALDPSGGGTPLRAGGAAVLRSNVHVPLIAALGSLFAMSVVTLILRRRRAAGPATA